MQFTWLTVAEATAYLTRAGYSGDSYGDRVVAQRRVAVPSPELAARIEESRRWNAARRLEAEGSSI